MDPIILIGMLLVLAFFITLFIGTITFLQYKDEKRSESLSVAGSAAGYEFKQDHPVNIEGSHLGSRGRNRQISNVLHKQYSRYSEILFDYHFSTHNGRHFQRYGQTVGLYEVTIGSFPQFRLRPRHFAHRFCRLFGINDISFESQPEFSKHCYLTASDDDEAATRALFSSDLLQYFTSNSELYVEGKGSLLIVYRLNVKASPDELLTFAAKYQEVVNLFAEKKA